MPQNKVLKQAIHWIDTDEALKAVCASWQKAKLLSIDTEFMRSRTYYPIAGLFQVNDTQANYLIDPSCIKDFSPLVSVLKSPNSIKVLHSCSEDLEVFHGVLGCLPENLFDTQIAAAILGYGFSMGLGNLCSTLFSVELPKSETRSNWLQRPLSEAQITYAALDVEYLTAIAVRIIKECQDKSRLTWVKEECENLKVGVFEAQDTSVAWKRAKGTWRLNERELYRFQLLYQWREEKARERDIPRNRILKEALIFDLAKRSPENLSQLSKLGGVTPRCINNDGEALLQIIRDANELAVDQLPQRLPRPMSSSSKNKLSNLKEKVQEKAQQMVISPEILLRRKDYEDLLRQDAQESANLSGWRATALSGFIDDVLKEIA